MSNRWGQDLRLQPGASFTASISGGTAPYQYKWYDGTTLKATTSTPTTQFPLTVVGARNIRVMVTDNLGRATVASCAVNVLGISLETALNTSGLLEWVTGDNADWYGQTGVTHDGVSAAQSGPITHSGTTWVETQVTVGASGTGMLRWWWKVSSEANNDRLVFYIDNREYETISGAKDWARCNWRLSAGTYTLKWAYIKNGSVSSGSDAAWLDEVEWYADSTQPSVMATPTSQSVASGGSSFNVSVTSNTSWSVSKNAAWLKVTPVTGSNSASLTVTCDANPSVDPRTGTLTFSGGGVARTVSVTQSGAAPALALSATSQGVLAAASSFSVSVAANIAWSAGKDAAWLAVTPASGKGNGTLSVSVAANPGAERTGKVTVSGSGLTRVINVTQLEQWDLSGLAAKGLKLSAAKTLVVPKGVKLLKGTKAVYTWKRDGVTVASGSGKNFTAKDSGAYTLTLSYTTADGQQHSLTQNFGKLKLFAQPKTATLTMAQTTDTITNIALRGTSVVSGEALKLTASVGAVGGGAVGPFRYVWYSGGAVVHTQESTATTDTFTTPAYGDKAVGYKCVIELVAKDTKNKPLGTAKSKDFKAKVILPPSAVSVTPNALTLTANAKGTAKLYYTWFKDGRQIGAASTNKKLAVKNVWFENAGQYYVVVTQDNTSRRVQSAAVPVRVQFSDGTVLSSSASPAAAPQPASPSAPAAASPAAALPSNSASVLNLAPLSLSAGDVLTVSGSVTREYIIVNETQHNTGAYRYEWRDSLTAEFQDIDAEAQLTLRFITGDGGMYEHKCTKSELSGR